MSIPFEFQVSSNKNRPRPVSYSVSIRVKLARSELRRILPGLHKPRSGARDRSLDKKKKDGPRPRSVGVASPEALRGASHSQLVGVSEERKVRPANPVRGATRSSKIGGRQGVDNLKP